MPPGPSLPTGTLTFLFSDIEGSTRLLLELGDAFAPALEEHQHLLREAFVDGYEVGTEGDSFFVVFPSATDAVAAAVAAQRALDTRDWGRRPVRVRMGLHTGEGRLGGDNYVGLDVHRAARIAAAAHGGQVLLSSATRGLVAAALPEGVTLLDLGEHRLKDLAAPERLWQLAIIGLPSQFDPPSALATRPNNLPRQLSSFVGRDADLRRVAELLTRAPMVTITGPGGVGKTRLAVQVAGSLLDRYPDGVYLVSLAETDDVEQVVPEIARTIGLRDAGPTSFAERLARYLTDRRMLLVLDNLEQLLDAAPRLRDLLQAAGVSFLVTSRSRLRIEGEQEYPLSPLAVAAAEGGAPATQLFLERARSVHLSFSPTPEDLVAIGDICSRLDGLPLAIELARHGSNLASPVQLLERLHTSFEVLGEGRRISRSGSARSAPP